MSIKKQFPNDKKVTVLRKDLSEYKAWQSYILINVYKWTASEVRVHQMLHAT